MIDERTREILLDLAAAINRRAYDPAADRETVIAQCEQALRLARFEHGECGMSAEAEARLRA